MLMKKAKLINKSCFERYVLEMLIALELLMSFTFLGYIHIPPISITFAYIPILIAACILGPAESTVVGFVFGAGSMFKASASYVMPADMIFSPFLSGNPVGSLMLSVGSRTLFGLVIGLMFKVVKRYKYKQIGFGIIAAASSVIHAFFVYSAMGIFFPSYGYRSSNALGVGLKDILVSILCIIVVEGVYYVYNSKLVTGIHKCIDNVSTNLEEGKKTSWIIFAFELVMVIFAIFAAMYFSQRAIFMLEKHQVMLTNNIENDLLHLHIQFLIAMVSLNHVAVLLIICVYKYMSYKKYIGEFDALTGVMGRRMFIYNCNNILSQERANEYGWFIFTDVDYFKSINDTYGHLVGDKVLKEFAGILNHTFGEVGITSRIGGDEFAVIVNKSISREEIQKRMDKLLKDIAGILQEKKITCSAGVNSFRYPADFEQLMNDTDKILYKAKENGRACYVIDDSRAI